MTKPIISAILALGTLLILAAILTFGTLLPSPSLARSLIINDEFKNVRTVVYEIPDADGRADTIRSVEAVRDRFYKGLEVIDAAKLDDSTLRAKLKGDFVLYTTLSEKSKLLKAAIEPLHMRIDGNTLRWGELNVPVGDLRVITIGKNPYGDGYCIVYAAGTNQLLNKVNSVFHGGCSYHIFRGDKLLKEGFFNEQFRDTSRISQAEAAEDVREFFSTLQRVHPDLLAKVDFKEYIALKQKTLDGIAGKLDKDGKMSVSDLAYSLYYAAAYFHDGHTSVHMQFQPNESNAQGDQFPPFLIRCDNGRFVVSGTADKSIEGLEIVSVDGKPIQEFLSPILDRCSGELLAFRAARFTSQQSFWYSFSNLLGSASSLTLRLRDAKGTESEKKLETVGLAEFRKLESDGRDKKQQQLRMQGTAVRFLDSDRIAVLTYPEFRRSDEEKKKIDSIFSEVQAKKSQNLIVDIRGNGGGNSDMGEFIFSYLYEKPFRSFSKLRAKLSKDVLSSVAKDWQIPANADIDGMIVTYQFEEQSRPKPKAFFSGRVLLLVDNGTFSSASDFAVMFRDYSVGKILGYETGGLPSCFGDVYSFSLKNSGISCGVSWKQFLGPRPRPGDDEHGVIPDITMSDELLRPYQSEGDSVLAFTLDYLKKAH